LLVTTLVIALRDIKGKRGQASPAVSPLVGTGAICPLEFKPKFKSAVALNVLNATIVFD
jgi:hypothetical protein